MAKKPTSEKGESSKEAEEAGRGGMSVLREWADALVIAFLLAMFIRSFVVELFKIPSGSMTPTLVGTGLGEYVAEWDVSDPPDGEKDLVLMRLNGVRRYHVFYRKDGELVATGNRQPRSLSLPPGKRLRVFNSNFRYLLHQMFRSDPDEICARPRNDRILVNKFVYWLRAPRRGEIVVFRVPPSIYERDKPIFIKRIVGLPGETVTIRPPHVLIDQTPLETPAVFQDIDYYRYSGFVSEDVPGGHYLVLGDNSRNSKDSRDWGTVSQANLKGIAVLRYWPLDRFSFFD
jgi:signal peptidase I